MCPFGVGEHAQPGDLARQPLRLGVAVVVCHAEQHQQTGADLAGDCARPPSPARASRAGPAPSRRRRPARPPGGAARSRRWRRSTRVTPGTRADRGHHLLQLARGAAPRPRTRRARSGPRSPCRPVRMLTGARGDRLGDVGEQRRPVLAVDHAAAPGTSRPGVASHSTGTRRSAATRSSNVFGQSWRCTDTPRPTVTMPITGSPGTGWQQRAKLSMTLSMPWMRTPPVGLRAEPERLERPLREPLGEALLLGRRACAPPG